MRYGLVVSFNIKQQKDYLNMDPTCSACLCEWMVQTCGFVYYTHNDTEESVFAVFSASAASIYEYMNAWT